MSRLQIGPKKEESSVGGSMAAHSDSVSNNINAEGKSPEKKGTHAGETIEGKSDMATTSAESITKRTAIEIAFGKI
jgi:hypothetical protein